MTIWRGITNSFFYFLANNINAVSPEIANIFYFLANNNINAVASMMLMQPIWPVLDPWTPLINIEAFISYLPLISSIIDNPYIANQVGYHTQVGGILWGLGLPFLKYRGGFQLFPRSSTFSGKGGTSIASKYLSKLLPYKLPFNIPIPNLTSRFAASKVLGRIIGRFVPIVGAAILAYDAVSILYHAFIGKSS
jgi:hypothetical protein